MNYIRVHYLDSGADVLLNADQIAYIQLLPKTLLREESTRVFFSGNKLDWVDIKETFETIAQLLRVG